MSARRLDTRAVHAGEGATAPRRPAGGVIYQTAPFVFGSTGELEDAFAAGGHGALYSRQGNPTVRVVEDKVADLEGADDAVAFASGMAAISTVLSTLLGPGDRLVVAADLYGGSDAWLRWTEARRPDLVVERVPLARLAERLGATAADRPPRAVYLETPSNPLLACCDLVAVTAAARRVGAVVVVDNTFATPVLQNPLALGASVVVHSATKFLGGHSDVTAGVAAGDAETMARVREAMILGGGSLDPHAAFLLARGMKTLALRVERQSATAARLAAFLAEHPRVERVYYPGDDPLGRRQMKAGGGVLSFEVDGGLDAARGLLDRLEIIQIIPSLGGVETGAVLPATSSHRRLTAAQRRELGIADGLIRLSCGIEAVEDLESDLARGLAV